MEGRKEGMETKETLISSDEFWQSGWPKQEIPFHLNVSVMASTTRIG
jgi:hypothetical protein